MKCNKEAVLILGGGLMQKPAVESAKKLGYFVCVADGNSKALCAIISDRFAHIDLKDKEGLLHFALNLKETYGLAAVFTAGTDFSEAAAYISEKCGLPGHSHNAAMNASNKIKMRECFAREKVASPHYIKADDDSIQSIFYTAERLGDMLYPLVVKPVDNMGGRGCRLVTSFEELKIGIEDARNNSRTKCAIVEDYMEGPEFSIDAIVYNGTLTVCGFADRHIKFSPYFIEMGHTMPSAFSNEQIYALVAEFSRGVHSLGLTDGVAKGDIKLTKKGPMIGEIAARLSGGYMSGWTFPYASDFELTEQALLIACGEIPKALLDKRVPLIPQSIGGSDGNAENLPFTLYTIPVAKTSAERAWISIPGRVRKENGVTGIKKAESVDCIKQVYVRSNCGDRTVFPQNNVEKCGNVISLSEIRDEAIKAAEKAVSLITINLEGNNPETEEFLDMPCRKIYPPSAFVLPCSIMDMFSSMFAENGNYQRQSAFDKKGKVIVPDFLKEHLDSYCDWNYKTLRTAIENFEELYPTPPEISQDRFWHDLIRGSIQGIVYRANSTSAENNKKAEETYAK